MASLRLCLVTLSIPLALAAGCGKSAPAAEPQQSTAAGLKVVATTTWEGALAKAAGASDVKVIVPQSVQHAPDYDPKPSDLAVVAGAKYVLYAAFEPYAPKLKEAVNGKAELVEVALDNDPDKVKSEVARLGKLFGTESAAATWTTTFDTEYVKLASEVKEAWPDGKAPTVVSQVFSTWSAKLAGATVVGTYGPAPVTPGQLAELSAKKPAFVLDNVHMSTGTVLPDSGAKQVAIVNYPGTDLDLLPVYRNAASELEKAMS